MSNITTYENSQGQKISLSPEIVRNYLVSGNGNVTDQEVMMFLSLCKYQRLNPFLREAYLVKFGGQPATIITGKEVFTKRAASLKECKGFEAGVIVRTAQGLEYRKGTLTLDDEELVGGWAKVYRQDWNVPLEITVSMSEYLRRKADGSPMSTWAAMPATMIRKVALVQALREAFPEDFGGMYSPEEMPVDIQTLPTNEIKPVVEVLPESPPPSKGHSASPKHLSEPQLKRLYAISKTNNVPSDALKAWSNTYLDGKSSKELTKPEYDELIAAIEDGTVMAWYNDSSIQGPIVDVEVL